MKKFSDELRPDLFSFSGRKRVNTFSPRETRESILLALLGTFAFLSPLPAEEELPGRNRLLATFQIPMGITDELVLTRVGWEDLLDRNPAFSLDDIPRIRQELRLNPTAEDYRRLTRLLYRVSRSGAAYRTAQDGLIFCQRQVEANSRSSSAYRDLGLAWVNLAGSEEAAKALGRALELGEKRADVYAAYALACLSVGQLEAARTAISKGLELFPTRSEMLVAAHYVRLNDNCQPENALRDAVRADDPEVMVKLLATDELRAAIENDPAYLAARRTLGAVLVDSLRERARWHSGIFASLRDLRALRQDRSLLEEATVHLDYALELDPLVSAKTVWHRAAASFLAGNTEEATGFAAKAIRIQFDRPRPDDSLVRGQYLAWLFEQGDLEGVKAFLKEDAPRVPSLEDFLLRASAFWKLGRIDEAETWARRLIVTLPRPADPDERLLRAAAHTALGAVWLSRGNDLQAEEEFLQAQRWSRKSLWNVWGLAISQALRGRTREAGHTLTPVAGLFASSGPELEMLHALVGPSQAKETVETNRREVRQRQEVGEEVFRALDSGLDWLLGYLSIWRSVGPFRASELSAAQRDMARKAIESLVANWGRADFPEPRYDLLAVARFLAGLEPNEKIREELAFKVRNISELELSRWKLQPIPENLLRRLETEDKPAATPSAKPILHSAFRPPMGLDQWAQAATIGCANPLEQAHALSAWLTLRPRLDFSSARPLEETFLTLVSNYRARFTPDESAALLIAAARAAGLKAYYVQLPRMPSIDLSLTSAAGLVLDEGLLLMAPSLGLPGADVPAALWTPEREANAIFYALQPGADRIERCQRAAGKYPDSARIRLALAEMLVTDASKPEEAVKQTQAVAQIAPEIPESHLLAGAAYELLGQAKEADAAFKQALQLNVDSEKTHHVRGCILLRISRFADAVKEFRAALEVQPHILDDRLYLAMALHQAGMKKEAMEEARRILLQSDDQEEIRKLLIDLLVEEGQSRELVLELEELLAAQPDNEQARRFLKELYAGAGMEAQAKALEREGGIKKDFPDEKK